MARVLRSQIVRQATGFAGANLVANGLAIVSTAIATRNLATDEFGNYAFAANVLVFTALFFEFGLFSAAARLASIAQDRDRKSIIGAALLVYFPVGVAYSATIFAISFWIDGWFHVEVGSALRVAAPLAIGIPFGFALQQLAQGAHRLHVSSIATALAQLAIVALFALQVNVVGGLSATSALALRSLAFVISGVACAMWLRPALVNTMSCVRSLIQQARSWGFQLYIGRVLSIGTYNMDVLMLGIWASARSVGLYVLAGSLATASGLLVTGLAAALFGRMAHEARIDRRWLAAATATGAASSLGVWLLAEPFIRLFFSARYVGAATLVLPLALAQVVRGVTGIFNTFLSAHGRGKELRNAGVVLTASNICFNFALIPPFGASGAAWASVLALAANLVAHIVVYRRFVTS